MLTESVLVFAFPDYDKSFAACTNFSSRSVSADLSQDHPVYYASLVFSSAESNCSKFEREALGTIFESIRIS